MNKTKKSIAKRVRITKNGKAVRRPMGVDHFRTRQSNKSSRNSRKTLGLAVPRRNIL